MSRVVFLCAALVALAFPVHASSQPKIISVKNAKTKPSKLPRIYRAGSDSMTSTTCPRAIREMTNDGDGPVRYEICLDRLAGGPDGAIKSAYKRVERAVDRVCFDNADRDAEAQRLCVRDTLYRTVLDAQWPALTAYYTQRTGHATPRAEVNPAKSF